MKISQLIRDLQTIQALEGDIAVVVKAVDGIHPVHNVGEVRFTSIAKINQYGRDAAMIRVTR